MAPVSLANIPTISQLYRSGDLQQVTDQVASSPPSTAINSKVALIRTSITDLAVTSIVNAANTSLMGGGGVDGAIHSAAGPDLLDECETLGGCETGSAKITLAYRLPSKYIIHAVGPIYGLEKGKREGLQAELLAGCYMTSLKLAAEKGGSIAFSCLSTGVYGYPSDEAAEIACKTVRAFLESEEGSKLERVVFCCFLRKDEIQYGRFLPMIFPPTQSDLEFTNNEQDEPLEDSIDPKTSKRSVSVPSKTGAPESDEWVTVDKPASMAGPDSMPTVGEAKLEEAISAGEPKASAGTSHLAADTNQGEQHLSESATKLKLVGVIFKVAPLPPPKELSDDGVELGNSSVAMENSASEGTKLPPALGQLTDSSCTGSGSAFFYPDRS
ncbi:MAG: hypothetical protein Q9188_004960 [Gyalolechia gomerana]